MGSSKERDDLGIFRMTAGSPEESLMLPELTPGGVCSTAYTQKSLYSVYHKLKNDYDCPDEIFMWMLHWGKNLDFVKKSFVLIELFKKFLGKQNLDFCLSATFT